MDCCICSEPIEDDDLVLRLTVYRYKAEDEGPNWSLLCARFDDGTEERLAHISCPVRAGAPMSLIGAGEGRIDD